MKTTTKSLDEIFKSIASMPSYSCKICGAKYKTKEKIFICSDCQEEHQKRVEEARRRAEMVEYLLGKSHIPRRYRDAIFKPLTTTQKQIAQYYIENFFKKTLEEATDVLLFGAIGTGKTYLSCAFALELIRKRVIGVKYITEFELLNLYFQKEYQEFENFKKSSVLIVDEIGKRELAEWQRVQLEELLSYRFNEMLPTIYITNLTEKRFKDFLGDRLADRLREANIARFAFVGESLRGI